MQERGRYIINICRISIQKQRHFKNSNEQNQNSLIQYIHEYIH